MNINCADRDGNTALILLCWKNQNNDLHACLETLFGWRDTILDDRLKIKINCKDHRQDWDIGSSSSCCLRQSAGANVNAKTNDGWSALHFVCRYYSGDNLIDLVQLMILNGVEVNSNKNGSSPLLLLCEYYNNHNLIDLIQLLVQSGADINAKTSDGWNALHFVCRYYSGDNLLDIIRLLIDRGIDVKAKDNQKWNALSLLCRFYKKENIINLIRLLVDNGIDINLKTNDGSNALLLLCKYYKNENLMQLIQLLARQGIDINAKDKNGWNALLVLCRYCKNKNIIELLKLLKNCGIDVKIVENEKMNALHILSKHYVRDDLPELFNLFDEYGIDVTSKNNHGLSVLDFLASNWSGNFHVILTKYFNRLLCNRPLMERLALSAAKLGCAEMACKLLSKIASYNVTDLNGNDAFYFLDLILKQSSSSCKICSIDFKNAYRAIIMRHRTISQAKISYSKIVYPLPMFERCMFDNQPRYNDEATYMCETISVKNIQLLSYQDWLKMKRAWNSEHVIKWETVKSYLSKHSHRNHENTYNYFCTWCVTNSDIDNYIQDLMKHVKELDPLLEINNIISYGSSAEKTNIFRPNEFDRGVILKYFRQSKLNTDVVLFTGSDHRYSFLKRQPINSSSLLIHFKELIEAAKERIYNVKIFAPQVSSNDVILKISIKVAFIRTNSKIGCFRRDMCNLTFSVQRISR